MIRTIHASIGVNALIVIECDEAAVEERTKSALHDIHFDVQGELTRLNRDGTSVTVLKPKVVTKVDYSGIGEGTHEPEAGTSGS